LLIMVQMLTGISPWFASSALRLFLQVFADFLSKYSSSFVRNASSNHILSLVLAFSLFLSISMSFFGRQIWVFVL
jgi:hypothetical protein